MGVDVEDTDELPIHPADTTTMLTSAIIIRVRVFISDHVTWGNPNIKLIGFKQWGEKMERVMVTSGNFNVDEAVKLVTSREAGGYVAFIGKVRERNEGEPSKVIKLVYESYNEMALKEMEKIREEAMMRFPVKEVLIWHRKGEIPVGGDTMLVIVAAAHRKEAFEACEWVVNEVKRRVPIWKKEITENGEFWVEGERKVPADR